jgi:hypothetical protein
MTEPEAALEQARTAAAAMRAAGAYPDHASGAAKPSAGHATIGKLYEWALIEPDLTAVRSTRRHGRPLTALKRALLRLLAQYHADVLAQQTRFNVNLVAHLHELEKRIDELERR